MADDPARSLLRLLAWSSPAFPIGGFAFSHGLERAVEEGSVADATSLLSYVRSVCRHGSGFADAVLLAEAYRWFDNPTQLGGLLTLAQALRGTSELALEAATQGDAALRTLRRAWPHPALDRLADLAREIGVEPTLPVVQGTAAAVHSVPLDQACLAQLAMFAANLVSAGVRLVPLGQTDGQRVTAALETELPDIAGAALSTDLDDLFTTAPMVDLFSIAHETQYTRLFRS